ncbi:MAG: LysM peptidoglycan-binding domain-containing protein [Desulfobacterales bacterium]|nr:LysM peptidoglycan-binding domain-containing protein [Desulfobacterales bacterium]
MKQTTIFRSVERCLTTLLDQPIRVMTPVILAAVFLTAPLYPAATASAQESETVEHGAGFYYTVKKGDTLWDLSQRFVDSPWLWPDLWQRNGQIANPHRIFPGERIRIYHKDWIERMRTQPESVKSEPEPMVVAAQAPPQPEPEEIPTATIAYSAIDSVGFIREYKTGSFGKIFKVEDDKWLISQGDVVYITPESGSLEVGSRYTIFKTLDPLKDKKTKKITGYQHVLLGIVEITAMEKDFAIGQIYRSFEAIRVGNQLMNYIPANPQISLSESVKGLKGRIIAAREGEKLIGDHMQVFLDKGSDDGVARGQRYLVYEERTGKTSAKSKITLHLPSVDYGTLLILHVEKTTATALVTAADKNIAPGDSFRAP